MAFTTKFSFIPSIRDYLINNGYTSSVLIAIINFLTATQFFGHLFLAFNRFSMIWIPIKYNLIWKKQWYTIVILGIPFLTISWRIHASAYYVIDSNNIIGINYSNPLVTTINDITLSTVFFSTTISALIFNVLSFFKFFMHKKNNSTLSVNEGNLLFISFVIFVAQLFRVSYNVNKLLVSSTSPIFIFFNLIIPILNGCFAWSGSISLFFLSSSTRKAYKSFYFCKTNVVQSLSSNTQKMFTTSTKLC